MSGLEVGLLATVILVFLVYAGMHIAIALALVSFVGVWVIRGDVWIAANTLALTASDSITSYDFGVIPLFVLLGMFVSVSEMGRDIFDAANSLFRRVRGGLGVATVASNAVFAAITGISIASASVFTRVAVPEMLRLGYQPKFAAGVVAGSSILGMLIPPSLLFIIFGILAETSIGDLFIAGIIPGILLSAFFIAQIILRAHFLPDGVMVPGSTSDYSDAEIGSRGSMALKVIPVIGLIVFVLGGIYVGIFTPTEAGGVGALGAFLLALAKRRLDMRTLWRVVVETGHITASVGFIIIAAHVYARMLAVAGMPNLMGEFIVQSELGLYGVLAIYIAVIIVLGTIIDPASIMLIMVPLFLPVAEQFGVNIVWFGVITVLSVEIGTITPPLGLAVFVIRNSLSDDSISLNTIFAGAFPFVLTVFATLLVLIAFPWLSLALL